MHLWHAPLAIRQASADTSAHAPDCAWLISQHRLDGPAGAQVLSVRWKGNSLWGFIEVLDTPSGRLIRHLYERGCKLGVSSRGWASLREIPGKPYKCIMDNFELITFDFVTEPSTRGAWLLPYAGRFTAPVPEQRYAEAVSRLGVGAVLPEQFPSLPHLRDVHAFLQDYLSHLKRVRVRHRRAACVLWFGLCLFMKVAQMGG